MDHVQNARPLHRSGSQRGTAPDLASPGTPISTGSAEGSVAGLSLAPAKSDAEPSGEPDSPGPRFSVSTPRTEPAADLFFDQPFGAVAGFLLGLATLLVPLAGVLMDRPLLPGHQESSERRFRPVAVAESPGNQGPGKTAPDR